MLVVGFASLDPSLVEYTQAVELFELVLEKQVIVEQSLDVVACTSEEAYKRDGKVCYLTTRREMSRFPYRNKCLRSRPLRLAVHPTDIAAFRRVHCP